MVKVFFNGGRYYSMDRDEEEKFLKFLFLMEDEYEYL